MLLPLKGGLRCFFKIVLSGSCTRAADYRKTAILNAAFSRVSYCRKFRCSMLRVAHGFNFAGIVFWFAKDDFLHNRHDPEESAGKLFFGEE